MWIRQGRLGDRLVYLYICGSRELSVAILSFPFVSEASKPAKIRSVSASSAELPSLVKCSRMSRCGHQSSGGSIL